MPKVIAVYLGEGGETASLDNSGDLTIYTRNKGLWEVLKKKQFHLGDTLSIRDRRQKMSEVISFLGNCKTVVGKGISGIPYFELEKTGCNIWEFEGKPSDFLDYILEEEESAMSNNESAPAQIPLPVEIFPGCYRFSLKDIQQGITGITSKQALQPFLRQKHFYSMEVICSHIPPWLEADLLASDFTFQSEKINSNTWKVTIQKKCCSTQ